VFTKRLSNQGDAGLHCSGIFSKEGRLLDQRGSIRVKTLFWLLFFALLLYGASKVVPSYVSFYMTKTDVQEQARIAHMYDDATVAKHILRNAQAWSVPMTTEDIEIIRDSRYITITIRYTDTIDFFGRFVLDIPREIIVEAALKESSGVLQ